ncbi:MAG: RNA polymerase sigma factor [Pseudomonadota bacterium]|nr:RNA polymerase sigma factor [Pseudomonadota bacterium]
MESQRDTTGAALNARWRPALMSFFLRRVRDHGEAEDLTQEVFVRMLKHETSDGAPDSYIFQIAQNLLVDRARRAHLRRRHQEALGADVDIDTDPIDPQRVAMGRAELARFATALQDLPERARVMFTLYRIDQLSQDAIGEAFGISKSAVKKQIAGAMAQILARMREGQ